MVSVQVWDSDTLLDDWIGGVTQGISIFAGKRQAGIKTLPLVDSAGTAGAGGNVMLMAWVETSA